MVLIDFKAPCNMAALPATRCAYKCKRTAIVGQRGLTAQVGAPVLSQPAHEVHWPCNGGNRRSR
jgi:hypothetical protein